ncbi:unnamed protein product [Clonostachys solani]|uniref:Zn(2)-C6 fungal-type domain-containing protein n=1 Tax=Clonostachys solani TaxID=160281 RepID=A0A9P0ESU7_9HYPO|nr:unnamed protein product [Clonostachys solani]
MEKPARKKRLAPRSRSGCLPCRIHHRKCDEQRPICGLCHKSQRDCEYGLRVSWGGRPFHKSSFGQYLSSQSTRIGRIGSRAGGQGQGALTNSHLVDTRNKAQFVYGFVQPKEPPKCATETRKALAIQQQTPMPLTTARPSFLPDLPPPYRVLFDYFTRVADFFSCDESVKVDFHATFMPIAITTSHVMAAMLNLAAVHRANSDGSQDAKQMAHLQLVAVQKLRGKLANPSGSPTEAILSTILLLCYSEIVAGGGPSQSWRLHLEGVASVLSSELQSWNMESSGATRVFLAKCFVSLVALANGSGYPPSEAVSQLAMKLATSNNERGTIDEFTAYSTDLVQILIELGTLLRKRNLGLEDLETGSLPMRAMNLAQRLHQMLGRGTGSLGDRASNQLSSARRNEYIRVDEAYHQALLIHIHQRLRGLPASSGEIQVIVRRLLNLVSSIELHEGPCPGTVLLFPLFSAGIGAVHSEDRQRIRDLLTGMMGKFGLGNVQQSLKLLDALWLHRDAHGESEMNVTWEGFIDENTDLILY